MITNTIRWTNKSVINFAEGEDPIKKIETRAREVAIKAIDEGWSGPPYDPIRLADILKTPVIPRDDVRDARTVAHGSKGSSIEFNPLAPRWRVRFSIAHEIAHTFFPDSRERIRNRSAHSDLKGDEWQLEFLCNLAASELLMPVGSFLDLRKDSLTIDHVVNMRHKYDVSMEAILMRLVKLTEEPSAVFFASHVDVGQQKNYYRLDYIIPSRTFSVRVPRGTHIGPSTILSQCASIGFTASGIEKWSVDSDKFEVECIGIPPLPGDIYPRVAGFLKPISPKKNVSVNRINYVRGDALSPRSSQNMIIAHIVNDQTHNWGGRSFASSLRQKWPQVQDDFHDWALNHRAQFSLGSIHKSSVDQTKTVVSMVAQKGYGPSSAPRIRYSALENCLKQLSITAVDLSATVHMPRIGVGNAGGSWPIIEELILDNICKSGISVTIYSLPDQMPSAPADRFLTEVTPSIMF